MVIIKLDSFPHSPSWLPILLGNQSRNMEQKEQVIFSIMFRHSLSSDASFHQMSFPEYTIIQHFLQSIPVTLQ